MPTFMLWIGLSFAISCAVGQNSPVLLPPVVVNINESCPSAEVVKETVREIFDVSPVQLFCPCGGPGEWRRMVHLDMSDPNQQCPSTWRLITDPIRGCGRLNVGSAAISMDSAVFPTNTQQSYSRVCGRIRGYPRGVANAFGPVYTHNLFSLEFGGHMSGISVTHGPAGSRQHIWSLAFSSPSQTSTANLCPCTEPNWPHPPPSFIGDNYFCDFGPNPPDEDSYYLDNPLWDGKGCDSTGACCNFNSPPWFCTTLPQSTTDDIELRLGYSGTNEDVLINLVDIYVK